METSLIAELRIAWMSIGIVFVVALVFLLRAIRDISSVEWRRDDKDPHAEAYNKEYPSCIACGGPNDMGEICTNCAKGNDPYGIDPENSGAWMAHDNRSRKY